jgi:hypothetical protein
MYLAKFSVDKQPQGYKRQLPPDFSAKNNYFKIAT